MAIMTEYIIGLMSGTSVDGIDAVLVDAAANPPRLLARHRHPLPAVLRTQLLAFNQPGADDLDLHRMALLDNQLARHYAEAVAVLLQDSGLSASAIRAIGSHGQTLRHAPQTEDPYTVQITNPSLLAELTGITVVADFRRRDMAAGGQGAPLAPAFHAAFLSDAQRPRAVVNIGGIANLTCLIPGQAVLGFDTGPGNGLLDAWAEQHLATPMDRDGIWASGGRCIPELLHSLLNDAYFAHPAPKSTGRDYFNSAWLARHLHPRMVAQDVQATLTMLTVTSIAQALEQYAAASQELLVCGGGVHNPVLMAALQSQLPTLTVASTASQGIDPDYMEAIGFAWLAQQTLAGQPGNLASVTGARGPRILGGIYPA